MENINSKFSEIKDLVLNNRKVILSAIITLLLVISIPVGVYLAQNPQIFKSRAFEKQLNDSPLRLLSGRGDLLIRNTSMIKDVRSIPAANATIATYFPKTDENRQWRKVAPTHSPPGTYGADIVYDSKYDRYILYGGYTEEGYTNNQTWAYKNGDWSKLEEDSAPGLVGHQIVDTPRGLVMFGGSKVPKSGETFSVSNEFFLLKDKEDNNSVYWQKIEPQILFQNGSLRVPTLRGMGMVYDKNTNSVYIAGGKAFVSGEWWVYTGIFQLLLPLETGDQDWSVQFKGDMEFGHRSLSLYEPLAFVIPGDVRIYLYGGFGRNEHSSFSSENKLWYITSGELRDHITQADWPTAEYAGSVLGGFDNLHNQLVLHSGKTTFLVSYGDYIDYYTWPFSVIYDVATSSWLKVLSPTDPPVGFEPAVAMNSDSGEMLRFGGAIWHETDKYWEYSNETWIMSLVNPTTSSCRSDSNCPSGYKCQLQTTTLRYCPDNDPNCNTMTGKCVLIPAGKSTPTPTATASASVSVSCSACGADADKNGSVGIMDMMRVAQCMRIGYSGSAPGNYSCRNADANSDGQINASDLNCARQQFGKQCSGL